MSSLSLDDKLSPNGRGQGYMTRFVTFLAPIVSLELVKLGTSNFVCWWIQKST